VGGRRGAAGERRTEEGRYDRARGARGGRGRTSDGRSTDDRGLRGEGGRNARRAEDRSDRAGWGAHRRRFAASRFCWRLWPIISAQRARPQRTGRSRPRALDADARAPRSRVVENAKKTSPRATGVAAVTGKRRADRARASWRSASTPRARRRSSRPVSILISARPSRLAGGLNALECALARRPSCR
jgi:hypothetical protein